MTWWSTWAPSSAGRRRWAVTTTSTSCARVSRACASRIRWRRTSRCFAPPWSPDSCGCGGGTSSAARATSCSAELGNVFTHPDVTSTPRMTKGGVGGSVTLSLPEENERLTVVLGREGDDATTAVAFWARWPSDGPGRRRRCASTDAPAPGFTRRAARSWSTATRAPCSVSSVRWTACLGRGPRRLRPRSSTRSARRRLRRAVRPDARDAAQRLRQGAQSFSERRHRPRPGHAALRSRPGPRVRTARRVGVRRTGRPSSTCTGGANLPDGTRSLAYRVRFSSDEGTLSESDVATARSQLIARAESLGATLR